VGEPWRTLERHSGQKTRQFAGMSNCHIGRITNEKNEYPPYQIITGLNKDGDRRGIKLPIGTAWRNREILADRHYFQAARDGELWTFQSGSPDQANPRPVLLERVRVVPAATSSYFSCSRAGIAVKRR